MSCKKRNYRAFVVLVAGIIMLGLFSMVPTPSQASTTTTFYCQAPNSLDLGNRWLTGSWAECVNYPYAQEAYSHLGENTLSVMCDNSLYQINRAILVFNTGYIGDITNATLTFTTTGASVVGQVMQIELFTPGEAPTVYHFFDQSHFGASLNITDANDGEHVLNVTNGIEESGGYVRLGVRLAYDYLNSAPDQEYNFTIANVAGITLTITYDSSASSGGFNSWSWIDAMVQICIIFIPALFLKFIIPEYGFIIGTIFGMVIIFFLDPSAIWVMALGLINMALILVGGE